MSLDPWESEWGNPPEVNVQVSIYEHIVYGRETRGTETSKYPQEEKISK